MSEPNPDDDATQDQPNDENAPATSRRSFVKALGAAGVLGGTTSLLGRASAAESLDGYLSPSGEETIPAGEYDWNDQSLSVGGGDALVGGGSAGDVVWNLQSGTMDGTVSGRLENIVVRGDNPEPKSGIDLAPGGVVDGFVWPEGGGQSEDRAFYHPDGGGRTELRNAAFGWMANNGAYVDKAPITIENVAAVNNNIANIRVGHWKGSDQSATTYVRDSLVALTEKPRHDNEAGEYSRGIRLRHPAHLVIENCYIVYHDVTGAADLVELHDEAAGSTVEIRNCHFYNDSGGALVRDKSGGGMDVTIEDCTVTGSGSREVQPDFDGNGFTEQDVTVPLPSAVTGYAVADEIEGIGPSVEPFGDGADAPGSGEEDDEQQPVEEYDHTLVLHADPDNPTGDGIPGDFDLDITVSGAAAFGEDAEPDSDSITENADGSSTIEVNDLMPDEFDSFRFDGDVLGYVKDSGYSLTVSLDGVTTTLDELVNGDVGGSDGDSGGSGDEDTTTTTDDTTTTTDDTTTTTTDDTTTTTTDDTTTTTDGSDDTTTTNDDGSDGTDGDSLPNTISFDGRGDGDVTNYTFTVSGSVARDPDASEASADGVPWHEVEDVALDGQVLGLVGSGVDVFRFSGSVTNITVDGDAAVSIQRDS